MFCPKCGGQIPDASAFCNKCGVALQPPAAEPPGAERLAAPAVPVKDAPEEFVWTGRPSWKGAGHWWLLWMLWIVGLAYIYIFLLPPPREEWMGWLALALGVAPALLISSNLLWRRWTIRYRLTTQRLFVERGLLNRHVDEVELIRVDDVSVHQNLIQRIFNVGVVTIFAPSDKTHGQLKVRVIDRPIEIKEKIRNHARARRLHRTIHMDTV